MITLFVKTGCPFCARVLTALEAHNVPFEEKNIADDAVVNELIALGGKRQVPFMIDGAISMYESADIVAYIEKTYGKGEEKGSKIRVHIGTGTSSVCPS